MVHRMTLKITGKKQGDGIISHFSFPYITLFSILNKKQQIFILKEPIYKSLGPIMRPGLRCSQENWEPSPRAAVSLSLQMTRVTRMLRRSRPR